MDQEKSLYKVTFKDRTEFLGGTTTEPNWKLCPNNEIEFFELLLPYGDKITLLDYEKFNFFIGAMKSFGKNKIQILHLYALGCKEKIVTSYRVTLSSKSDHNRYKVGDITVRQFPFGKEGIGQTATSGWK